MLIFQLIKEFAFGDYGNTFYVTTNRQEGSTVFKEEETFAEEIEDFKRKQNDRCNKKNSSSKNKSMHRFGQVNFTRTHQLSATFNGNILKNPCEIDYDPVRI